jgi:hypothetical protein
MKDFLFLNPAFQGFFLGLIRRNIKMIVSNLNTDDLKHDLEEKGLSAVSWTCAYKYIKDKDGQSLM